MTSEKIRLYTAVGTYDSQTAMLLTVASLSVIQDTLLPCRSKVPVARASHAAAVRDNEDFDAKNARLGRPQSPHLSIYRPQLTTVLSVTHRATGMVLGGIVTMWGIGKITSLGVLQMLEL